MVSIVVLAIVDVAVMVVVQVLALVVLMVVIFSFGYSWTIVEVRAVVVRMRSVVPTPSSFFLKHG